MWDFCTCFIVHHIRWIFIAPKLNIHRDVNGFSMLVFTKMHFFAQTVKAFYSLHLTLDMENWFSFANEQWNLCLITIVQYNTAGLTCQAYFDTVCQAIYQYVSIINHHTFSIAVKFSGYTWSPLLSKITLVHHLYFKMHRCLATTSHCGFTGH